MYLTLAIHPEYDSKFQSDTELALRIQRISCLNWHIWKRNHWCWLSWKTVPDDVKCRKIKKMGKGAKNIAGDASKIKVRRKKDASCCSYERYRKLTKFLDCSIF